MSAAYGLVKFKKTGNVYMCCYNGTADIMIPFIFRPEECIDEEGRYLAIYYGKKLAENNSWEVPDVSDVDDIEIYSDYGYGFYWQGKGSESSKFIISGSSFEECDNYSYGKPKWVDDFWDSLKNKFGNTCTSPHTGNYF